MINANAYSDDHIFTAKFDATEFFKQAELKEIVQLASIGWGGDYAADDVATFFEDKVGFEDVTKIFEYTRMKEDIGFECHVDEKDAMIWLRDNRPDVFEAVAEKIDFEEADLSPKV